MVKAIVFDFWGTLAENGVYSPLKQTYEIVRARMRFSEFVVKLENLIMTKKYESQRKAFEDVLTCFEAPIKDFIVDKLVAVWNENAQKAELYPETIEVLEALKKKKIKLAIISNSPSFSTEEVLERLKLKDYFKTILLSCNEGFLKTNPELFDLVAKKLKVEKNEMLMVGDSVETDIEGAKKAGVNSILVDRKNTREFSPKITDLKELLDIT